MYPRRIRCLALSGICPLPFDKIADPDLVVHRRALWRTTYHSVAGRFNELGLHGDPVPPKLQSEYRILVLGDSVTFGFGMGESETFTSRLERALRATSDRSVRVINSGVGGYNTVQEYVYFQRERLSLSPDRRSWPMSPMTST